MIALHAPWKSLAGYFLDKITWLVNKLGSINALLIFLDEDFRLAKNFEECERKALSRRGKLIIRLDYMMHEALRLG